MTKGTEAREHAKLSGPDLVTLTRFPVAAAICAVSLVTDNPSRPLLIALVTIGVATDVVDGWWARHRGQSSDRGARLDSAADVVLSAAVTVAVASTADFPAPSWLWWALGAITAVRVAALIVTVARFNVASIAHTWANKAAGSAIAAAVIAALATAQLDGWLIAFACLVAGIAALDELALVSTASSYRSEARGSWDRARLGDPPRRDGLAELP